MTKAASRPLPLPKPARRRKSAPPVPLPPEQVRLLREHEHQGKKLPAGAQITVHPLIAQWLRAVCAVAPQTTTKKD